MSKTIKKPYTKSKKFDKSCRSHGGCPVCYSNRLIHTLKELDRTNSILNEQKTLSSMSSDS